MTRAQLHALFLDANAVRPGDRDHRWASSVMDLLCEVDRLSTQLEVAQGNFAEAARRLNRFELEAQGIVFRDREAA